MTGGGTFLAFFLLLELAIRAPSCCFIYGNKRQAGVDLWLLLSKWGKKMTWGLWIRKGWRWIDLQKVVVASYAKLL
jgi:hypothetical protein